MQSPEETRALQALQAAYSRFTRDELARALTVSTRTLERWQDGSIPSPGLVYHGLNDLLREAPVRCTQPSEPTFTFIDLFAGIGGTRLGFERAGGRCVFTSEYDRFCNETYRANFRPDHAIAGASNR